MTLRMAITCAGMSALLGGTAWAQSTNTIPLGTAAPIPMAVPAPNQLPVAPVPMPDMSQINPTAGPVTPAPVAPAAATPPNPAPSVQATPPASNSVPPAPVMTAKTWKAPKTTRGQYSDHGEVEALNWLQASGYRNFSNFRAAGNDTYRAQVIRDGQQYEVLIDPARDQITRIN